MHRAITESLPAWLYRDEGTFALEKAKVFRQAWQIVRHVNGLPEIGDQHALDFLDEMVAKVRGEDRLVRSFYNVCRHRASRLAEGERGNGGVFKALTISESQRPLR